MPCLVDGIYSLKSSIAVERRYQHVLAIDLNMRSLVATLPAFLMRGTSQDPRWPPWVSWARSTLTISAADKVSKQPNALLLLFSDHRTETTNPNVRSS